MPHQATNAARDLRQKFLKIQVTNKRVVDFQQQLGPLVLPP
jgi:hypothetical protein